MKRNFLIVICLFFSTSDIQAQTRFESVLLPYYGFLNDKPSNVSSDEEGTIYFTCRDSLYKYDKNRNWTIQSYAPYNAVFCAAMDKNKNIWCGSDTAFFYLDSIGLVHSFPSLSPQIAGLQ